MYLHTHTVLVEIIRDSKKNFLSEIVNSYGRNFKIANYWGEPERAPHRRYMCAFVIYIIMYVGGSTYVPPFTIAEYKYIPYTFGTTCTRLYTLGVRDYRGSLVYILTLSHPM